MAPTWRHISLIRHFFGPDHIAGQRPGPHSGNDANALYADVWGGLQGQMPAWEGRLSPIDRKILVLYILDRRRP